MTDPAPGAGDDKTNEQADVDTGNLAAVPVAVAAEDAAEEHGQDPPETAHDGNSEVGDTTEPDSDDEEEEDDDDGEEEEEEEEDEEPRLKYARLTQNLAGVYKNADATSSFLVAGDKMVWAHPLGIARARALLTSSIDHWHPQWQHQCNTATSLPVPAGVPCSFRLCDNRLDLPLSTTIQHWQT